MIQRGSSMRRSANSRGRYSLRASDFPRRNISSRPEGSAAVQKPPPCSSEPDSPEGVSHVEIHPLFPDLRRSSVARSRIPGAGLEIPPLYGKIVDQAQVLQEQASAITAALEKLEAEKSCRTMIMTVGSLEGNADRSARRRGHGSLDRRKAGGEPRASAAHRRQRPPDTGRSRSRIDR